MSWVLAYENGNGVNTDALKQTFNYMLSNPAEPSRQPRLCAPA